jgi:hypothetical protein
MITTLEKVKRLEVYLSINNADSVLDKSISKLLVREQMRMKQLISRLQQQLAQFEQQYHLSSQDFYARYSQGEMGDDMDFIEWASTVEMITNAQHRLILLGDVT